MVDCLKSTLRLQHEGTRRRTGRAGCARNPALVSGQAGQGSPARIYTDANRTSWTEFSYSVWNARSCRLALADIVVSAALAAFSFASFSLQGFPRTLAKLILPFPSPNTVLVLAGYVVKTAVA